MIHPWVPANSGAQFPTSPPRSPWQDSAGRAVGDGAAVGSGSLGVAVGSGSLGVAGGSGSLGVAVGSGFSGVAVALGSVVGSGECAGGAVAVGSGSVGSGVAVGGVTIGASVGPGANAASVTAGAVVGFAADVAMAESSPPQAASSRERTMATAMVTANGANSPPGNPNFRSIDLHVSYCPNHMVELIRRLRGRRIPWQRSGLALRAQRIPCGETQFGVP